MLFVRLLYGLICVLFLSAPAMADPVYVMQNEPHLTHAKALVLEALKTENFEANFSYAPVGNEHRNLHMISSGQTHLDMMPATPARLELVRQGKLRMIPIPLDRGILSFRVNLLLESRKDILKDVRKPKDMQAFVVGQNEGWMDIDIYKHASIPTKEVRNWSNGEFVNQMEAGFIDLFPLGLEETLTYFLPHFRESFPQLSADSHVLVRYPWFRFVWLAPGPETDALYAALQRGFDSMANDGTFMKVWLQYRTNPNPDWFRKRQIIAIENPFYGDDLVPPRYKHLLFLPE